MEALTGTETLFDEKNEKYEKKKNYLLFLCWLFERYSSSSVDSLLENQVVHC